LSQCYCSKDCQKLDWKRHKLQCTSAVENEMEVIAEAFFRHGKYACCLPASLILANRLRARGIDATIRDGFYVSTSTARYAGRHVWVESKGGVKHDIGLRITQKCFPSKPFPQYNLVNMLPDDVTRVDNETPAERQVLADMETFLSQIRIQGDDEYWRQAPKEMRQIYKELCL
jgi:hypothetical protein